MNYISESTEWDVFKSLEKYKLRVTQFFWYFPALYCVLTAELEYSYIGTRDYRCTEILLNERTKLFAIYKHFIPGAA